MTSERRTALLAARAAGMTWVQVAKACGYNHPQTAQEAWKRAKYPSACYWTDDEIAALRAAWESGEAPKEIAARFGISRQSVVQMACDRGWSRRRRPMTVREREEIHRLYLAGVAVAEIAARVGRSVGTVRRWWLR